MPSIPKSPWVALAAQIPVLVAFVGGIGVGYMIRGSPREEAPRVLSALAVPGAAPQPPKWQPPVPQQPSSPQQVNPAPAAHQAPAQQESVRVEPPRPEQHPASSEYPSNMPAPKTEPEPVKEGASTPPPMPMATAESDWKSAVSAQFKNNLQLISAAPETEKPTFIRKAKLLIENTLREHPDLASDPDLAELREAITKNQK